jgi:hypothetical protein
VPLQNASLPNGETCRPEGRRYKGINIITVRVLLPAPSDRVGVTRDHGHASVRNRDGNAIVKGGQESRVGSSERPSHRAVSVIGGP